MRALSLQVLVVFSIETRSFLSFARSEATLSNLSFLLSRFAFDLETAAIDSMMYENQLAASCAPVAA